VIDQAENRLHAQTALLERIFAHLVEERAPGHPPAHRWRSDHDR